MPRGLNEDMHPYKYQPPTAFWEKSVSNGWNPDTLTRVQPLLRRTDKVASLGSCFAANLVPYLRQNGFQYIEEERRHPLFARAPAENLAYDKFSAAYGNIYTARQFRQLLERSFGDFCPQEDRWQADGEIIDPFRPGLRYRARTPQEFDALSAAHLSSVRAVFEKASVVIFTLGLTEAWRSKADGAVFPVCPGTIAGSFDAARHEFHNFSVGETVGDLAGVYSMLRVFNPQVRLILTVSPVPLVATAGGDHVLIASTYSKSALRAACGEFQREHPEVVYFPAYEIITGPQAPGNFFESDRRNVSREGVDEVMRIFIGACEGLGDGIEPPPAPLVQASKDCAELSGLLSRIECEEAANAL